MTDQLTIGGGVGERWTTTRNTIDKALRQLDPEVEYRLGGGSVTLYWEVDTEIKTWLGDSTERSGPDSRRRPI